MASDLVTAECIEAQEFMDLSRAHGVSAVPKTIVNEDESILGALPQDVFLQAILRAGSGLV